MINSIARQTNSIVLSHNRIVSHLIFVRLPFLHSTLAVRLSKPDYDAIVVHTIVVLCHYLALDVIVTYMQFFAEALTCTHRVYLFIINYSFYFTPKKEHLTSIGILVLHWLRHMRVHTADEKQKCVLVIIINCHR